MDGIETNSTKIHIIYGRKALNHRLLAVARPRRRFASLAEIPSGDGPDWLASWPRWPELIWPALARLWPEAGDEIKILSRAGQTLERWKGALESWSRMTILKDTSTTLLFSLTMSFVKRSPKDLLG